MDKCKMTTTSDLGEILDIQCEKLRDLETATLFIRCKDVMKDEFIKMEKAVSQMCKGVETMKKKLEEIRGQNNQCRDLLALIKTLDERIIHMEKKIPPIPIRDDRKNAENSLSASLAQEAVSPIETIEYNEAEMPDSTIRDCKKTLFKEPDVYPIIRTLNTEEFTKVPKYIIGRQSLDTVNNLIDTINQILKAKYTFLALGKAHARKQGDLNLFLHYKKQDMEICTDNEYMYFFTAEDYEKHTNTKLNKIKLNLLTVLRHCKRLREHRVKNTVLYVIITKT